MNKYFRSLIRGIIFVLSNIVEYFTNNKKHG